MISEFPEHSAHHPPAEAQEHQPAAALSKLPQIAVSLRPHFRNNLPVMVTLQARKELPPVEALQGTGWLLELTAEGMSMEPLIRSGDAVSVRCLEPAEVRVGDVICHKGPGGFVLHRAIDHDPGRKAFLEKGDSTTRGDWIEARLVLGVLERINGQPFENRGAELAARFGRAEQRVSDTLGRRKLKIPAFAASIWRRIKTLAGKRGPRRG